MLGNLGAVMVILKDGITNLNLSDFKFNVAGGVTGLALQAGSFRAYDANGILVAGLTPVIQ